MQVVEKSSEGLSRTYEVTIPQSELSERLDAKIKEMQPQVRLKGFRPGKVPASHIRKVFGKSILSDIVQDAVNETSQKALTEQEVTPASEPHVHLESKFEDVVEGKSDLAYHIHLDVMPKFEPAKPADIELVRPVAEVGDEEIQNSLKRIAESNQNFEDKGKKAAAEGDRLTVDFVGSVDGEEFEGGAAEGAQVVIGAGQFIPGFEEGLTGAKAGEEKTVEATFPEQYQREDLAGKTASFKVTVKAVEAPAETKIDDDLAKSLGLESLDALKEAVKQNLEREYRNQSRARAKRRLLDALDERHDFELPKRMVDAEFDQIWSQVDADRQAGRLDEEDAAKSEDELKDEYRKIAERRVRLGLVLAEIGRVGEVRITEEEVSRAVNQQAAQYPGQERQVVEFYNKNPQALAQLRAPIYEEKVVDYILELAKVEDETVSRDELFTEDEMPGAGGSKPAKKAAAKKKAPAKKTAAKKAPAKKAAAKSDEGEATKAPAKKTAAKKAPAKKAAASKASSSKSTASKSTAKKPAAKKTPAKK